MWGKDASAWAPGKTASAEAPTDSANVQSPEAKSANAEALEEWAKP